MKTLIEYINEKLIINKNFDGQSMSFKDCKYFFNLFFIEDHSPGFFIDIYDVKEPIIEHDIDEFIISIEGRYHSTSYNNYRLQMSDDESCLYEDTSPHSNPCPQLSIYIFDSHAEKFLKFIKHLRQDYTNRKKTFKYKPKDIMKELGINTSFIKKINLNEKFRYIAYDNDEIDNLYNDVIKICNEQKNG